MGCFTDLTLSIACLGGVAERALFTITKPAELLSTPVKDQKGTIPEVWIQETIQDWSLSVVAGSVSVGGLTELSASAPASDSLLGADWTSSPAVSSGMSISSSTG
ncbi:MAG: hypothetical protein JAZ19_20545, partial [Candidatus Thiodiazotropha taylori]|nr:hypothetical protein [Candidatus Thiodiazotropha taylori]